MPPHDSFFSFPLDPFAYVHNGSSSANGKAHKSDALAELAEAFKPKPTEVEKLKARIAELEKRPIVFGTPGQEWITVGGHNYTISHLAERIEKTKDQFRDERDVAKAELKKSTTKAEKLTKDLAAEAGKRATAEKELAELKIKATTHKLSTSLSPEFIDATNWLSGKATRYVRNDVHEALKKDLDYQGSLYGIGLKERERLNGELSKAKEELTRLKATTNPSGLTRVQYLKPRMVEFFDHNDRYEVHQVERIVIHF